MNSPHCPQNTHVVNSCSKRSGSFTYPTQRDAGIRLFAVLQMHSKLKLEVFPDWNVHLLYISAALADVSWPNSVLSKISENHLLGITKASIKSLDKALGVQPPKLHSQPDSVPSPCKHNTDYVKNKFLCLQSGILYFWKQFIFCKFIAYSNSEMLASSIY